ncbi:hypothetical protein [Micromonospora sp. NPDC047187]|uniref:hypothetical protein n=1 Tax=Micromonospora sp. NPDC047187 TaxID=3155262 RepID=UPI0033F71441
MEPLDTVLAAHRAYLLGWNIGVAGGPDLPTYRSDVPHAPLNGVLRVVGRTPWDALTEARKRLHGVPRIWWVGPDSDAGAADGLVSLGAVQVARMPIMTVGIGSVAEAPTPAGVQIAETTDLAAFVPAYARVSGIPADGVAAWRRRSNGRRRSPATAPCSGWPVASTTAGSSRRPSPGSATVWSPSTSSAPSRSSAAGASARP